MKQILLLLFTGICIQFAGAQRPGPGPPNACGSRHPDREFQARDDGEMGPWPSRTARALPASDYRANVGLRPDRALFRPSRLWRDRRGDGRVARDCRRS